MKSWASAARRGRDGAAFLIAKRREMWKQLRMLPSTVDGSVHGEAATWSAPRSDRERDDASTRRLDAYFDTYAEGPGLFKWRHYFGIYERHFEKFVGREVHVVEIGVFAGGSLPMWHAYFGPACHVYGVDIDDSCLRYEAPGTRIFVGDQADPAFWRAFRREVPIVDILIDDGGHKPHQQQVTLEQMLDHLQPGGVYLCEDIHGAPNAFAAYVGGLSQQLHAVHEPTYDPLAVRARGIQATVQSVHVYPFVTVIEKATQPIHGFEAPRHGTVWPPRDPSTGL